MTQADRKGTTRTVTIHPLKIWREARRLSLSEIADLLADTGPRPSVGHLRHVEKGRRPPGWTLSRRLAALLGQSPQAIKEWRP